MSNILPAMGMVLLADAAPAGPYFLPMGGSVIIAGVLLSVAIATGGMWLVRRSQHRPASSSRKYFFISLGGASCFAAVAAGLIGIYYAPLLAVALALLVTGLLLIRLGMR
jgi:hypothetical protein